MNHPAHRPPAVRVEAVTRRRGITRVARELRVGYSHLYRCLRWLGGDTTNGRQPGRDLEAAIRARYPELITPQETRTC